MRSRLATRFTIVVIAVIMAVTALFALLRSSALFSSG